MDRLDLLHEMSDEKKFLDASDMKWKSAGEAYGLGEDWGKERDTVNNTFLAMLSCVTGDGSKKRQSGSKPPWWKDPSHEAAIFSHLNKWKHGELKDKDSGAHPLIHLAWRCLAIAYQETYGKINPEPVAPDISVVDKKT